MNRFIQEILWWWQRKHCALSKLPGWRKAMEAERHAVSRGCTQAIHRARKAKQQALHAALGRKAV